MSRYIYMDIIEWVMALFGTALVNVAVALLFVISDRPIDYVTVITLGLLFIGAYLIYTAYYYRDCLFHPRACLGTCVALTVFATSMFYKEFEITNDFILMLVIVISVVTELIFAISTVLKVKRDRDVAAKELLEADFAKYCK